MQRALQRAQRAGRAASRAEFARKLCRLAGSLLLAVALIGTVDPSWGASASGTVSPLPPAGAAGVKEAQGEARGILLGAAVTGGIFVAILLLVDGEDSGPVTATATSE
jgi:hypothetical protein